ncbi:ABC transporter permease [Nocardioides sp. S5]|nr:ABC transporter permease [Nocardioides sp. S5]
MARALQHPPTPFLVPLPVPVHLRVQLRRYAATRCVITPCVQDPGAGPFLIPFLDLAIGQSPMLRGEPAPWATWLPGYGGTRVMIDGALTRGFDESASLAIELGWIALLLLASTVLLRGIAGSAVLKRPSKAHTAHA